MYLDHITYIGYKRELNRDRQKINEQMIMPNDEELKYALEVVGNKRNEYVLDPKKKSVSYFVIEQRTMNARSVFQGENYAWTMLAEFVRFGGAAAMCYVFRPAGRRFLDDVPQVLKGKLGLTEMRHPISNFFLTIQEYNKAKHRVNARLPKEARPWNYRL